jgi:hypothetical protein
MGRGICGGGRRPLQAFQSILPEAALAELKNLGAAV